MFTRLISIGSEGTLESRSLSPALIMETRPTTWILSILLIVSGAILLLESYGLVDGISRLWPVFPCILGIGFILLFARKRSDVALPIIGTYLVCAGLLFFVLNFTTWHLLADLWPLFVLFLGLSFLAPVLWGEKRRIFAPLAFILILLGGAFLLVFTIDPRLWPATLILFGICLLIINRYDRGEYESTVD